MKRGVEHITFDTRPQPADFGSLKISFKTEVTHSSQFPRDAVPWNGEVQVAESIDDLITSASMTKKVNTGLRES